MTRLPGLSDRLFRHDARIVANGARSTFARWHDRLIALILAGAVLAGLRGWCDARPWTVAVAAAAMVAALIGLSTQRLVYARLAYHGRDGILAADALTGVLRRRYAAAWHAIALAVLAIIVVAVHPALLGVVATAYVAGVFLALTTGRLRLPRSGARATTRAIRPWLHHPLVGLAAAALLLVALAPVQRLGHSALVAAAATLTLAVTWPLTMVDDAIVRFMTIAGRGSGRIIADHARSIAAFTPAAVVGTALLFDRTVGAAVLAGAAVTMTLLGLRVLAYRLHPRRTADFLVSVAAALLVAAAYMLPVSLPFVMLALFWRLQRRAAAASWRLA